MEKVNLYIAVRNLNGYNHYGKIMGIPQKNNNKKQI